MTRDHRELYWLPEVPYLLVLPMLNTTRLTYWPFMSLARSSAFLAVAGLIGTEAMAPRTADGARLH